MFSMNTLKQSLRVQIVHLLVEGNSLRGIARLTGVSRNTIAKLLQDVGAVCLEYQDKKFRKLRLQRVQCDEIWSFVHAKEKNKQDRDGVGDVWTWTAIDPDTKLVFCWHVGGRSHTFAQAFMKDLAKRVKGRFQLTTDGHKPYLEAVEKAFKGRVDYAQLVKVFKYHKNRDRFVEVKTEIKTGKPDPSHISTNAVERQNLTMRQGMRRFMRSTNAFSKKIENHMHAVALHFMYYNFCRIHRTLRVTPAMEAGISDTVMEIEDIIDLMEKGT